MSPMAQLASAMRPPLRLLEFTLHAKSVANKVNTRFTASCDSDSLKRRMIFSTSPAPDLRFSNDLSDNDFNTAGGSGKEASRAGNKVVVAGNKVVELGTADILFLLDS